MKENILQELPPSSDKEFWGDGEVNRFKLEEKTMPADRHFPVVRRGPYFVCKGCNYEHTIPTDPKKYTVKDGYLVRLDKV